MIENRVQVFGFHCFLLFLPPQYSHQRTYSNSKSATFFIVEWYKWCSFAQIACEWCIDESNNASDYVDLCKRFGQWYIRIDTFARRGWVKYTAIKHKWHTLPKQRTVSDYQRYSLLKVNEVHAFSNSIPFRKWIFPKIFETNRKFVFVLFVVLQEPNQTNQIEQFTWLHRYSQQPHRLLYRHRDKPAIN